MVFDALPVCQQKWIHSMFFLSIPKTASTSVSSCLGDRNLIHKHRGLIQQRFGKHPLYRGVFDLRHLIPLHIENVFGRQVLEFFSFCCVRQPIERIVSSYYFGREKKLHSVYGLPENTTLDSYIDWLYANRHRKDILILLPQTTWTHNNVFPVEILRFENLSESWPEMLTKYQISNLPPLPHENKSQHKDWREEISGESLKKVLDFTFEDCKLYPELYD